MKKLAFILIVLILLTIPSVVTAGKGNACTTIKDGTLEDSDGNPLAVGYDQWGYNYQARMLNGYYCNTNRDTAWCQPSKDVRLSMQ